MLIKQFYHHIIQNHVLEQITLLHGLGSNRCKNIQNKLQVTPTGRNKSKFTRGKSLLEQVTIAEDKDLVLYRDNSIGIMTSTHYVKEVLADISVLLGDTQIEDRIMKNFKTA